MERNSHRAGTDRAAPDVVAQPGEWQGRACNGQPRDQVELADTQIGCLAIDVDARGLVVAVRYVNPKRADAG